MSKLVTSISKLIKNHESFRKSDLTDKSRKIRRLIDPIVNELNNSIINNVHNITLDYSSGSPNNPTTPVLYFYDKRETLKGTEGVYCILLFRCLPDKEGFGEVLLTLTQGEKSLKDAIPERYQFELADNANSICESYCRDLKEHDFKLCTEDKLGSTSRAVEKTYQISFLNSDKGMIDDIKAVLNAYTQFINVKVAENQLSKDLAEIKGTSKTRLIEARLGQGKYRNELFSVWQGKCCMSGCDQKALLRASHIKPWRDCTNQERLDPMNGLLLTPNLDVVFDQGYISFDKNGLIVISKELEEKSIHELNIPTQFKLLLNGTQSKYMRYHRENIFRAV